ncbi:hypothetical protein ACWEK5_40515 [Rhodococcus koreensis]|uniref:hypothetical protein n=1 Tax=Rhodococcus sp. NPDC057529 TaxID=3346158 RepID=UPI00366C4D68
MKRLITPATVLVTATGMYGLYLTATTWSPIKSAVGLGAWAVSAIVIFRHEYRKNTPNAPRAT